MIQTHAHQKALHEARIDIKTLERLFANVITEGTNCSALSPTLLSKRQRRYLPSAPMQKARYCSPVK